MKSLLRSKLPLLGVSLMLVLTATHAAAAQQRRSQKRGKATASRTADAARHAREAADTFNQIMRVPDKAIPRELLEDADAVIVCPNVLKAAFIVGGRKGDCVISRRVGPKRGWGPPAFYNLSGGSIGLQAGAASTDFVLLVMNEEGLRGLMEDKFEIGGEASIAAGPVGRSLSASTTPTLDAGILSYSRSKGLFGGIALKGVAITPDNDLNEAFYGRKANEILTSETVTPSTVRAFPLMLSRYSVRK